MTTTKWRPVLMLSLLAVLAMPTFAEAGGLSFGKLFKMSKGQEEGIATEMHDEFVKDPGLITKGDYFDQITRVGKALVDLNGLKQYDYQFFLIDQAEVNAFATPAGYIYVTKGLMDVFAYDESMLAGVMAHELGHAKDRHVAKGYEKMISGALGLTVLGLFIGDDNGDLMNVLFAGGQVVLLKYNRDQEEWADRAGVDLSYNAGYDPYGMVRGLECLEALYGSATEIDEYMSQHPATDDRVARTLVIAKEVSGLDHGYRKIPKPPSKDHPLWAKYGSGEPVVQAEEVTKTTAPATQGKTTSPVKDKQEPTEIKRWYRR